MIAGLESLGSQQLSLPESVFDDRPALAGHRGQSVIVGVRPEDLEDASLSGSDRVNAVISSTVSLTEALGSEIIVHVELDATRVDAGDEMSDTTAVGRFDPRSRVRMGEPVDIAVNVENLHFFDPTTHLSIWH